MMRLIDQYAIWQKGYALEWERRVRETLLPQYREAIAPHIIAFMESYIKIPKEIPQRIAEAKYEILREKKNFFHVTVTFLSFPLLYLDFLVTRTVT